MQMPVDAAAQTAGADPIASFVSTWGASPHPAYLLRRDRRIVASNNAAAARGAKPGLRCFEVGERAAVCPHCHADLAMATGQAELRRRLRLQVFAAIAQRITLRYHLSGLTEQELKVAGVSHALFSDDAARLIYRYTKGIPRQVNNLCTAALLAGFSDQRKIIEESTVKQALLEMQDETAN